jgi:acyl carrier protein
MARFVDLRNQVDPHLCQLITSVVGIPAEQVRPSATLQEDLELDPFDLAELLEEVETVFRTTISEDALSSLRTVGDLERHLHHRSDR